MADANKMNGIYGKDISKVFTIPTNTIYKVGNVVTKFDILPQGLILPLNAVTVPDGWEYFSSANDRLIIGAGDTYAPGATGGVTGTNITNFSSYGTSSSGAHAGSKNLNDYLGLGPGSGWVGLWENQDRGVQGSHFHTGGNVSVTQLDKNEFKLIRSTQENDKIPENVGVFSSSSLSETGMSVIQGNNKMFGSYSSTRELTRAGTLSFSTAGDHTHIGGSVGLMASYNGSPGYHDNHMNSGDHSASVVLNTITQNFKRLLLSLWTSASTQIEGQEGMIAMWESLTPPDGWLICNGSNGTPDLRNNFIQNCASGNENTTSQGNNTATVGYSGNVTHSASHSHWFSHSWFSQNWTPKFYYHNTAYSTSHTHTFTRNLAVAFLPRYYALSFIMKAA